MRLWYWFLLIVLVLGIVLVSLGFYYIYQIGDYQRGWEFSVYGSMALAFVLAVGFLYFERWRRRWWEK